MRRLLLKGARRGYATLSGAYVSETRQRSENSQEFFFRRLAATATGSPRKPSNHPGNKTRRTASTATIRSAPGSCHGRAATRAPTSRTATTRARTAWPYATTSGTTSAWTNTTFPRPSRRYRCSSYPRSTRSCPSSGCSSGSGACAASAITFRPLSSRDQFQ